MYSIESSTDLKTEAEACSPTTILVCVTCRQVGQVQGELATGSILAAAAAECVRALGAAGQNLRVECVRCLANCSRGLSAAIRRDNAWAYIFGDLDPNTDGNALVEGAMLLAQSTDGLMPWRSRPEPLRRGLIARLPPHNVFEDVK